MKRNGIDIKRLAIPQKVHPNITIESNTMGMVPELEEREAAVYVICPWKDWIELPYWERAAAVAHFRMHLLIDSHVSDAAEKAAKVDAPGPM